MQLSDIYQNQSVKEFGEALGKAIGKEQDYASLTDLEFAQTKTDFADALHRFLRRFHTMASKRENLWYCPSDSRVEELMQLVDRVAETVPGDDSVRYREAIRLVRAALISRALAQATYLRVQETKQRQAPVTQQSQS
jgi:hypothetical protein